MRLDVSTLPFEIRERTYIEPHRILFLDLMLLSSVHPVIQYVDKQINTDGH